MLSHNVSTWNIDACKFIMNTFVMNVLQCSYHMTVTPDNLGVVQTVIALINSSTRIYNPCVDSLLCVILSITAPSRRNVR